MRRFSRLSVLLAAALMAVGLPTLPKLQANEDHPAPCNGPERPEHEKRIDKLPDGGSKYVFDVDNREHDAYVPPDGFNPLAATDAQLIEYGFPHKPGSGPALDHWKQAMAKAKKPVAHPSICKNHISSSIASDIWSGYEVDSANQPDGYSTPYWGVDGLFQQAPYNGACGLSDAHSAWVGMDNNSLLEQAGTEQVVPGTGIESTYAFYEVYNANKKGDEFNFSTNLPIYTGDSIYVDVTYWSANLGATWNYEFLLENTTQGVYEVHTVAAPPIVGYFRYAEAIDERPSNRALQPYPLLNFWQTHWDFADTAESVNGGDSDSFYNSRPYAYGMWNGAHALANPSPMYSDSSFFNYFNQCL